MMTLKNLVYLSVVTAAAGACDVKQDLGETAGATESGSGSGGTTDVADTGVFDTDSGGTTDGTTGSEESGVLDTGPWWGSSSETGEETGEPLEACEASEVSVRWDSSTITGATIGFTSFAAVSGTCVATGQTFVDSIFTLSVQCELGGTVDGTPEDLGPVDLDIVLEIDGASEDILPAFGPGLGLNVWVTNTPFGLGSERHMKIFREVAPGEFASLMLLADSQRMTPVGADSYWEDVTLESVEATCAGEAPGLCGEGRGIAGGWMAAPPTVAHEGQLVEFEAASPTGTYSLFVDQAWEADDASDCPKDAPTAHYRFVAFSDTP